MAHTDDETLHYLSRPRPPPVTQTGSVLPALKQTVGEAAAHRHKRLQYTNRSARERRLARIELGEELRRKKYAEPYAAASPCILQNTPRSARTGQLKSSSDHVHSARLGASITFQSDTQTVLEGGDLRFAQPPTVSLGSRRLNALAAIVANNPLLRATSENARATVVPAAYRHHQTCMDLGTPRRVDDDTLPSVPKLVKGLVPLGAPAEATGHRSTAAIELVSSSKCLVERAV